MDFPHSSTRLSHYLTQSQQYQIPNTLSRENILLQTFHFFTGIIRDPITYTGLNIEIFKMDSCSFDTFELKQLTFFALTIVTSLTPHEISQTLACRHRLNNVQLQTTDAQGVGCL